MKKSELRKMIREELEKENTSSPVKVGGLQETESSMRRYFPKASKAIVNLLKRHKLNL